MAKAASKGKPRSNAEPSKQTSRSRLTAGGMIGVAIALLIGTLLDVYGCNSLLGNSSHMPQNLREAHLAATELEDEFRQLQEGRLQRDLVITCVNQRGGGCSGLSAEVCNSDAALAERCCRSCHDLTCLDKHPMCLAWSQTGECYKSAKYMAQQCCRACSRDFDDICSLDPKVRPDVAEGDIDRIFKRAIANYPQYSPIVHSHDPWVVTFDNLLNSDECEGIKQAVGGQREEYIRPSTTAKSRVEANGRVVLEDIPDEIRTSQNAWCQHEGCFNHPVHRLVISRIMGIVGLNQNNAEHMQLLKYEPGQYYRLHHDWIPEQLQAQCGPRAFTFFLYLSDVEDGGGTQFPYINITVQPKKGSAVWWPHGLNENPWQKDDRTHHEAMPVLKGVKYAANYWIHGSDFKTAMATGCDGRNAVKGRVWRK